MDQSAESRATHSRLRWRCRRGMRELDVLFEGYLEHTYPGAAIAEQRAFQRLLELQDPQVLAYLLGQEKPTDAELVNVIHKLAHSGGAVSAP